VAHPWTAERGLLLRRRLKHFLRDCRSVGARTFDQPLKSPSMIEVFHAQVFLQATCDICVRHAQDPRTFSRHQLLLGGDQGRLFIQPASELPSDRPSSFTCTSAASLRCARSNGDGEWTRHCGGALRVNGMNGTGCCRERQEFGHFVLRSAAFWRAGYPGHLSGRNGASHPFIHSSQCARVFSEHHYKFPVWDGE
jgi:hypothetical protein